MTPFPNLESHPQGAAAASSRGIHFPHVNMPHMANVFGGAQGGERLGWGGDAGGGAAGSAGAPPEVANSLQSPPEEETKPPATFGGWLSRKTYEWARGSDVFGIFLATPEEIEAYAYHERLLVILHILLITLFCSSIMSSLFACPISQGYASIA